MTGLFFLIVTFQKSGALTLLRAIGAPAGRLVSSLLFQVVLILGLGLAFGTATISDYVYLVPAVEAPTSHRWQHYMRDSSFSRNNKQGMNK